jgi:HPt (histidine-containing phosphotransfer) domain-containing protein
MQHAAHTLKGSACVFAAERVTALAQRLEAISKQDGLPGAADVLTELERETNALCRALAAEFGL